MKKAIYYEEQRFTQLWIFLLLVGLMLLFAWGIFQQVVIGEPFGDNPAPTWLLLAFGLIPVGLLVFFWRTKLKTTITETSIIIDFRPLTHRVIPLESVQRAYVRKYKPIREFGGWGLRIGSKGMAYNTSGNVGLQLELKNGGQVLIGTQQKEQLEAAIKELLSSEA